MTEFGTLEMVTDPEVKRKEAEAGVETPDPVPAQSPTPPPEGKSDTAPVPAPANQTQAGSSKGKFPLDQGPQYLLHWIISIMSRETCHRGNDTEASWPKPRGLPTVFSPKQSGSLRNPLLPNQPHARTLHCLNIFLKFAPLNKKL